jgi:hypothetical protein
VTALESAFQASQDKLAELVPGARHLIAAKSGHYIQLDQPKLVTRAVRSVVREARRKHAKRTNGEPQGAGGFGSY